LFVPRRDERDELIDEGVSKHGLVGRLVNHLWLWSVLGYDAVCLVDDQGAL
jgi:hypothetical protein